MVHRETITVHIKLYIFIHMVSQVLYINKGRPDVQKNWISAHIN